MLALHCIRFYHTYIMKIKQIFFLWGAMSLISLHVYAQSQEQAYQRTTKLLFQRLQQKHYNPIQLTDAVGQNVLEQVLHDIDPEHIYFSQKEIQKLQSQQGFIDNQIINGEATVLIELINEYQVALQRSVQLLEELKNEPLDFTADERIKLSRKGFQASLFPKIEDVKARLKLYLKWDVLDRLYTDLSLDAYETKAEEVKVEICQRWVQRLKEDIESLKDESNSVSNSYFNAIAEQYDPHSSFFSVNEMKLFETMLSESEYTFGFSISEDRRGNLKISSLDPGGPAWRSDILNKGDILLKIEVAGGKIYNLTSMTASQTWELLEGMRNNAKIILTVRKKTGVIQNVALQKEKVNNEENVISSFVLEGEKKVGYVYLPSFYTDMEGESQLGCANDLAKQLINLKKDGIEGLIIDLRNNGGGSMGEAIDMIGMFIDIGPVAIKKGKEKATTLKDWNRGTIYNGPMVVLTNRFSASASEFFAAAMQDYNRALVVGGRTFGKSTGQNIMPLSGDFENELLDSWESNNNLGFMKITTFKFYRITGKSHQKEGVVPDIPLPQMLDALDIGEDSYATALPADSIDKKTYARILPSLPKERLWFKSRERVTKHAILKTIPDRLSKLYIRMQDPIAELPLEVEAYAKYMQEKEQVMTLFELQTEQPVKIYDVKLSMLDREIVEITPNARAIYDVKSKRLSKDIYLEEAYSIMLDWLKL